MAKGILGFPTVAHDVAKVEPGGACLGILGSEAEWSGGCLLGVVPYGESRLLLGGKRSTRFWVGKALC